MRSPGEPLNIANLPQNQGIQPFISVPAFYGIASPGYTTGIRFTFIGQAIPVHKGNYNSRDVPFQPMRTEYKS